MAQVKNAQKANIFDAHHKIERFAVIFLAFVISLGFICAFCFKHRMDMGKLNLTERAVYTTYAVTSLSKEPFNVKNVYRNNDFTKAYILLKFDESHAPISTLNTNANKYSMFMTSGSGGTISGSPTGAVYVYGTTGYVGLYFANGMGFDSQLYDILIRSNDDKAASYDAYGQDFDGMIDLSDKYHNQMHIRVNFGGTEAVHADFLEEDIISTGQAYNEMVLSEEFIDAQSELNDTLIAMYNDMTTINEISSLLSNDYGVRVPSLPSYIAGDYITNVEEDTINNPTLFSTSMLSSTSTIVDNFGFVDEISDSSITELVTDDKCYYVTDFVYPGGIQFNYQNLTSTNHTYSDIIDVRNMDEAQVFFDKQADDIIKYQDAVKFTTTDYYKVWYFNDGTIVPSDLENAKYAAINSSIKSYEETVSHLIGLKETYQKTLLPAILASEVAVDSLSDVTTINSDALKLY